MKTLIALCLLALVPSLYAGEAVLSDSASNRVTVTTSDKGVQILDDKYGTYGYYFIEMKPGLVPLTPIPGGFAIADPALARAIDNRSANVRINFISTIVINKMPLPVTIVFRKLPPHPKATPVQ